MRVRRTSLLTATAVALMLASPLGAQTTPAAPSGAPNSESPAPTSAQTPKAEPHSTAGGQLVENADIIAMVQNRLSDEAILGMIELNETRFDVSAGGLIALKKAGVSDRVLNAMLESARRRESPAAAPTSGAPTRDAAQAGTQAPASESRVAAPAPSTFPGLDPRSAAALQAAYSRMQSMGYGGPGSMPLPPGMGNLAPSAGTGVLFPRVVLILGAARSELTASVAQRAVSKFNGGGPNQGAVALKLLANEALAFASFAAGPAGMYAKSGFSMLSNFIPGSRPSAPKITYAWGLPGAHSTLALPAPQPSFELVYKDIPGIDPDAYEPALVRLVLTRDNYRLVGATRQEMRTGMMGMGAGGAPADWITEDRLPAHVQKTERGAYTLLVDQSLPAGEYAVVLRPVKHYKAQPSGFGGGDQLSATVWDFSLPEVRVATAPENPKSH